MLRLVLSFLSQFFHSVLHFSNQAIEAVENHYPTSWNPSKKQVVLARVTTFRIKHNIYSEELIQNEVVLFDI